MHFREVLVQKRDMNDEAPGHPSRPLSDPGEGARLDALGERLRSARAEISPKPAQIHSHSGVDAVFRLVGGFVSPILIGVAGGWAVDHYFGLSPIAILLGTFVGLGLGFYVLVGQAAAGSVRTAPTENSVGPAPADEDDGGDD